MAWLLIALFVVTGCVHGPTHTGGQYSGKLESAKSGSFDEPLVISPETRVLDARGALEYGGGHLPQAYRVQWSDFSQSTRFKGVLDRDLAGIARRLARLGIGLQTDVIVVGKGLDGSGEEGRIAWMLNYLGVGRVKTASLKAFSTRLITENPEPMAGVPLWDPEPRSQWVVSRGELLSAMRPEVGRGKHLRALEGERVVIIDVRSEKEYLQGQTAPSELNTINIEWKQFFTRDGRPNKQILPQLDSVGITPDQRLIVIDDQGVRSAAATYALQQLGFKRAGNYMGGLEEFLAARRPSGRR